MSRYSYVQKQIRKALPYTIKDIQGGKDEIAASLAAFRAESDERSKEKLEHRYERAINRLVTPLPDWQTLPQFQPKRTPFEKVKGFFARLFS